VFTLEDRENHPDFPKIIPHFYQVQDLVSEENMKGEKEV
jgi:hypothetical protein